MDTVGSCWVESVRLFTTEARKTRRTPSPVRPPLMPP